ncbi:MAG: DUF2092 domain-containing protein [Candidatus Brocadiaceae bacterium]|nr:DUF2092 domain-containing protein [Candidatus Brocadiaceae bacterium]
MKHPFFFFVFAFVNIGIFQHTFSYAQQTVQEKSPSVEPVADTLLMQMSEYLKSAERFTVRSQATFEKVFSGNQKIQYGETVQASVRRPDRLHVDIQGDLINHRFRYDGKKISMLDTNMNIYAAADAPADIDSMLRFAAQHFGITAPLADLVITDPYANLIQNVTSGTYVGLHTVHGIPCHHLAFTQENLDWQIWIEDGRTQVPRKLVITYKLAEGAPQYTALLSDWNFSPHLPDSVFTFIAPEDAEETEFLPLEKKVPEKIGSSHAADTDHSSQ